MPLSKARNAARNREYRAQRKASGTVLMPKSLARKLRRLGVNPTRYLRAVAVSLDDYRDLKRQLDAKAARVEWQSSGILMLHEKVATLEALLATQPAMVDTASQQRIMALEAEMARLEAMLDSVVREGELS